MNKMTSVPEISAPAPLTTVIAESKIISDESLIEGNRKIITDFYFDKDVSSEPDKYRYKIYIRVNAHSKTFKNVSFEHCVFDGCYFNRCVFNSCNFTGCRFLGCNFHRMTFSGCQFEYASFERCQLDTNILGEAPKEENLKMRFARSLRMNYQQIGDAEAANKAILIELDATKMHLWKSWGFSRDQYYRDHYPGFSAIRQFFEWLKFKTLHLAWGNGESILRLLCIMSLFVILISLGDAFERDIHISNIGESLLNGISIFLGINIPQDYSVILLCIIASIRFIAFALLVTLLVKRLGRR